MVIVLVIFAGSKLLKYLTSPYFRSKHPSLRSSYVPYLQLSQPRVRLIRGLSYGSISGILSAHSLLLAKSAVELLVRTIVDRVNQFNRWQSWAILIAMITLALSQLFYLHRGLKLCSTSVLYPFVFCIYNIIAILDGLIYFRQMSLLTRFHAGLIALGTVFLLGGVLCLSWRLEDIDSHTAVTVAGASQTGLGPGMAILEEHAEPPLDLEFGDEESHVGEREPLLRAAHRPPPRGALHQRTPSLPLHFSPLAHRDSADVDPASIWAELDDSDCDYGHSNPRPRVQARAFTGSSQLRQGNKPSGTQTARDPSSRRPRHFSLNQLTWNPPRVSSFAYGSTKPARRPSSPGSGNPKAHQKRHSHIGPFSSNWTVPGYGSTQDTSRDDNDNDLHSPGTRPNHHTQTSAPLAGPRSIVRGAWRSGLRYLARLTGSPGARSAQPHDPETDALQSNPH